MRTRAGEKVGGVLTPGPHRDCRHCPYATLYMQYALNIMFVLLRFRATIVLSIFRTEIKFSLLNPLFHLGFQDNPLAR